MKSTLMSILIIFSALVSQPGFATGAKRNQSSYLQVNSAFSDTLLTYLSSLDLSYYKGKPVDSFLMKLPVGYSQMKVMDWDASRYATFLWVKYDTIRLLIFVNEFHHMSPKNHSRNWDINLFRMENVACIEIWNRRQRVSPECKWWE